MARIVRPAPPPPRPRLPPCSRVVGSPLPPAPQLGFKAQPAFLSKFGTEEKRRVCLDVHQFVACISVCHSDYINHPKSKQIFTLMDHEKKGEVVLDDFVTTFETTGGAAALAEGEQKMLQQYIVDAREKGTTGLSHDALQNFLAQNTAGEPA